MKGRIAIGMFILSIIVIGIFTFEWPSSPYAAEKGETLYQQGKSAATVSERVFALNAALDEFLAVEKSSRPNFGTGKLYYDIGNTYFLLEDYPNAIFYYVQAKRLMPRSESVERNLSLAREKVSLPPLKGGGWLEWLLLERWIPLPNRLQLFALFGTLAALTLSLAIWQKGRFWKFFGLLFLSFALIIALNLAATRYLSPIEAVLVKGEFLRRDAGASNGKVGNQPLPAGSVVEVIEVSRDGQWMKIMPEEGTLGFVATGSVRVVGHARR